MIHTYTNESSLRDINLNLELRTLLSWYILKFKMQNNMNKANIIMVMHERPSSLHFFRILDNKDNFSQLHS